MTSIIPFFGYYGILSVVLAIWIYLDAEIHGQDGILWAIIVFFLSIPALIVYFLFFRQGIAPAEPHRAVNRNEDFLIRRKYLTGEAAEERKSFLYGKEVQAAGTLGRPDPGFEDRELEHLIKSGQIAAARKYLTEMLQMAKEMNDEQGRMNYLQYEAMIERAERKGRQKGNSTRT
jgi:hypothetical protein